MKLSKLERAAIRWWKGKRPLSYNHKQHLANPEVNCCSVFEHQLCKAVHKHLTQSK